MLIIVAEKIDALEECQARFHVEVLLQAHHAHAEVLEQVPCGGVAAGMYPCGGVAAGMYPCGGVAAGMYPCRGVAAGMFPC